MVPLQLKLKKQQHRDVAKSQDIVMETLVNILPNAILHGGTGIWRCYAGNRFSEDIDVYLAHDKKKIETFFQKLHDGGFTIVKKRISDVSIYSTLQMERIQIRFEALFKKENGILHHFQKTDGNILTVFTLTPEQFLKEKIATYTKRRKVRDLYDIYFLLQIISDISLVQPELSSLLSHYQAPLDEEDLKTIVYEGIVPTSKQMMESIKYYGKEKISGRR